MDNIRGSIPIGYLRALDTFFMPTPIGNCPDCDTDSVHADDCPRALDGDWDRPFNVIETNHG